MRFLNKMKNSILRTLLMVSAFTFVFCALLLDSDTYIPLIGCVLSAVYMLLFFYMNDRHYELKFRRLFCENRW